MTFFIRRPSRSLLLHLSLTRRTSGFDAESRPRFLWLLAAIAGIILPACTNGQLLADAKGTCDRNVSSEECLDRQVAIQQAPKDDATTFYNRAVGRTETGDFNGALADYTRAIELDPELAEAYLNRGYAHDLLGNIPEAMDDYSQAIALAPDLGMAYFNRSSARLAIGDFRGAIADSTRAIELDANAALAYVNRGAAELRLGEYDEAVRDSDLALQIDPNLPLAYLNRGSARISVSDRENGIRDIEKAGELFQSFGDEASYQQIQKLLDDV